MLTGRAHFAPRYSPGRKDMRVPEARAMLKVRRTLDGLTEDGLRCQFNLKSETAAMLLAAERARRDGSN
jgi:hypothetical protein